MDNVVKKYLTKRETDLYAEEMGEIYRTVDNQQHSDNVTVSPS